MIFLLLGWAIAGCSPRQPSEYTFEQISAYMSCTREVRRGTDPAKITAEAGSKLIATCDEELRSAAQALASRHAYENPGAPDEFYKNMTAQERYRLEARVLRELALCATSTEAERQLCADRID